MPRFEVDPNQSRLWIDARSTLHGIHSESNELQGWFEADVGADGRIALATAPRAHLELPVAKLTSGNPLYDREMRRRIDARRFPVISGDLTSMREGDSPTSYVAAGDITFKGVSRSYEDLLAVSLTDEGGLRIQGQRTFDVRDFGMEPPRILTLRVYPEVTVRIDVAAALYGERRGGDQPDLRHR